ncbi:cyclic AMP-responsive element-binding protein 3-like protein 1 isoform X2 [Eucyclogobius newberryi]|uniref:cyclic AMP-responsive element-binding protein 3-like protein 1 isoform X2 n=1 Tax=Eucyclogobius newberryi TaxID=166745 RepID=UPI003B5C89D9
MDDILESLAADKLYPTASSNLLDLEELSDGDFLSNVPFSGDQMEDFSSDLFSSFFDDHLLERPFLNDRPSMLHLELDTNPEFEWSFNQDLSGILVKQEEPDLNQSMDTESSEDQLTGTLQNRATLWEYSDHSAEDVKPLSIKDEPKEMAQYLSTSSDESLLLPPTPPSSNHSDSDGSLPPSSPPPQRPGRATGASAAISSSPLLTAPHKLQGSGPLMLTEEEKRTLVAEGYPVPIKLPLSKGEEKALKRVRRKIKNKISAQESRRKKKEYVECLEKKVDNYTSENGDLWRKVENLETANRSLLQQLQKLQSLISGKVIPRSCKMASTQTGTCLMMVALCFVLVLGSFSPCASPLSLLPLSSSSSSQPSSAQLQSAELYTTSHVRSRSLLFFSDEASDSLSESQTSAQVQVSRTTVENRTDRTQALHRDSKAEVPDVF